MAHDKDLWRVMEILRKDSFMCDIRKCHFFRRRSRVLQTHRRGGARRPAPGKLKCIEKWDLHQTVSEMPAFLGFTNYYSVYIHKYAETVAPFQEKLKVPGAKGKKSPRRGFHGHPRISKLLRTESRDYSETKPSARKPGQTFRVSFGRQQVRHRGHARTTPR